MTIVFDFDGTLADSQSVVLELYNDTAKERDFRHINREDWPKVRRMGIAEGLKFAGIKAYQIPGLLALGKREMVKRARDIKLFPGVADVVKQLNAYGHEVYLLSTNSNQVVNTVLKNNGLIGYLTVLKSSQIFGKARAIRGLMRKHKLKSGDVWMVGDEVRDIQAAQKAGVNIISVTWGFQPTDVLGPAEPTALAQNPADILKIIQSSHD